MKRFLAPILLLTLLFPSIAFGETIDDLVEREGLHYKKFTEVPFTGKINGFLEENGEWQGTIRNGKKDGPWIYYWTNGHLQSKGTYKDGKKDGPWVYHSNGSEVTIPEG